MAQSIDCIELKLYQNYKVGFIGAGNMTQALLGGFIKKGLTLPSNAYVSAPTRRNICNLEHLNINTTDNNRKVLDACDIVFLSVKPHILHKAVESLGYYDGMNEKLFVSLVAGVKLGKLESMLNEVVQNPKVIRVVPNTPCLVAEGCCVFSMGKWAAAHDGKLLKGYLGAVSFCEEIPEYQLNAVGGLSGSGPAYIYAAIEALADGGVKMGLPREISLRLAAQTVKGAATMVLQTGKHPGILKDEVCSPGGSTIVAMHSLEKTGLRNSLISAVEASTNRTMELG